MQIERARWTLSRRMAHGMSMPENAQAPSPAEAQNMSPLSNSGCTSGIQVMSAWGKQQWYNGDQIFVSPSKNCTVTLGLPVKTADEIPTGPLSHQDSRFRHYPGLPGWDAGRRADRLVHTHGYAHWCDPGRDV